MRTLLDKVQDNILFSRPPCHLLTRSAWEADAGQANYGYANAACEMLALARRRDGLPAHVLAWAAVDDAGYVAEVLQVCPK